MKAIILVLVAAAFSGGEAYFLKTRGLVKEGWWNCYAHINKEVVMHYLRKDETLDDKSIEEHGDKVAGITKDCLNKDTKDDAIKCFIAEEQTARDMVDKDDEEKWLEMFYWLYVIGDTVHDKCNHKTGRDIYICAKETINPCQICYYHHDHFECEEFMLKIMQSAIQCDYGDEKDQRSPIQSRDLLENLLKHK